VAHQTRTAALAVVATGVLCAVVATVVEGGDGLWSAVLGTVAVLGFFVAGLTPLLRSGLFEGSGGAGMVVVLVGYVVRLVALVVLVTLVTALADLHRGSLGLTIIACSAAWVLGAAVAGLRGHVPLDIPDHGTGSGPGT
jgi:hypothetical protein